MINTKEALKDVMIGNRTPAKWMNSDEEVEAMIAAEQQQAQMQQMAQLAQQGGQGVESLARAAETVGMV